MTDNNLYWRIHLHNGEVWLCQEFGLVGDVVEYEKWPDWADEKYAYAMIGAVLDAYMEVTDVPPSELVILPNGVCAVEKLSVPRLSGYHQRLEGHKFP